MKYYMSYYSLLLLLVVLFTFSVSSSSEKVESITMLSISNFPNNFNSFFPGPPIFAPIGPPKYKSDTIIEDAKTGIYLHHILIVKIGDPPQELSLKLSTAFCGIWVYNKSSYQKGFKSEDSRTFQRTSLISSISNVAGSIVQDTLELISFNLQAYKFLLVNEIQSEIKTYDGALGFGYNCGETKDSLFSSDILVDYLMKSNGIANKVFFFKLNSENKGVFTIGGYPNEITEDPKHYKTIKVLDNQKSAQWLFQIYIIYFDEGEVFYANSPVSFGIDGHMFSVSQLFFEWFMEKYFKSEIKDNICEISKNEMVELYCNEDYDYNRKLPAVISIVVGKWSLKIKTRNLFKKIQVNNSVKLSLAIIYYPQKDQYYISQNLIGPSITVYDREHKQIGIYFINE